MWFVITSKLLCLQNEFNRHKELKKVAHLFGVDNIRRNSVIKDWHYFVADVKIADCWIKMFSREVEDPKEKDLEDAEDIKKEMEVKDNG